MNKSINKKAYRKLTIFLLILLLLTCFGENLSLKADELPGLMYSSKVIYIGNDRLSKYTDNCWTPSKNVKGWTVKYQVVEGGDIITVANNGKITATGVGIGAAKVKVTYSKKGSSNITAFFTVKVRRNATHIRLTDQSLELLNKPIIVGETVKFNAAKSYDGSYKKGHYGLDNYMGVISDNLRLESMTPGIIETDGLAITAKTAGIGKFVVKAYQYSENRFTGILSQVYTIEVKEKDINIPDENNISDETTLPELTEMDMLFIERVVLLTNIERENEGLQSLVIDNDLSRAAQKRAIEISNNFSHISEDIQEFYKILDDMGLTYNEAGENISYGYKTPEEVVNAWLNSEEHKLNILHDTFTSIGIGIYSNDGIIYWVQAFKN